MTARDLYEAVQAYAGNQLRDDVLLSWATGSEGSESAALVAPTADPVSVEVLAARSGGTGGEALYELYALSRVSDVLLFSGLPTDQSYGQLWQSLGMAPIELGSFDPCVHEIVSLDPDAEPAAPVTVLESVWPGLQLGSLLFRRQGVRVRAGSSALEPGVADRSPMYWAHRRRERRAIDPSLGWGSNSQWGTAFRRDYLSESEARLNVDGRYDATSDEAALDAPELGAEERASLVAHRCLVRAFSGDWDDLFPWNWTADLRRGLSRRQP